MSDQDQTTRDPEPVADSTTEGETAMPNPKTNMYVQWVAGDNDWSLDSSASPNPKKKTKAIVFEPDSGPHDITFSLWHPTPPGWKFANPAISTEDDAKCPPNKGLNSKQIEDPRFDDPGTDRVLRVTDRNDGEPRLVRYELYILDDIGNAKPPCDPAILNGGKN